MQSTNIVTCLSIVLYFYSLFGLASSQYSDLSQYYQYPSYQKNSQYQNYGQNFDQNYGKNTVYQGNSQYQNYGQNSNYQSNSQYQNDGQNPHYYYNTQYNQYPTVPTNQKAYSAQHSQYLNNNIQLNTFPINRNHDEVENLYQLAYKPDQISRKNQTKITEKKKPIVTTIPPPLNFPRKIFNTKQRFRRLRFSSNRRAPAFFTFRDAHDKYRKSNVIARERKRLRANSGVFSQPLSAIKKKRKEHKQEYYNHNKNTLTTIGFENEDTDQGLINVKKKVGGTRKELKGKNSLHILKASKYNNKPNKTKEQTNFTKSDSKLPLSEKSLPEKSLPENSAVQRVTERVIKNLPRIYNTYQRFKNLRYTSRFGSPSFFAFRNEYDRLRADNLRNSVSTRFRVDHEIKNQKKTFRKSPAIRKLIANQKKNIDDIN